MAHNEMPGPSSNYVPIEAVWFTAIITSIFAVYLPHTETGAPAYARISLLVVAVNNITKSLTIWLSIPDGGMESSINVNIGSPSVLRTIAVGLRRKFGQELFWYSVVLVYISYYVPKHTFSLLKIHLVRIMLGELTNLTYRPFRYQGKNLQENTPEEYGFTVDVFMVIIPLLYAYLNADD